jgi:hypothetical protein
MFKYLNPKNCSRKYDPDSSSRIRILIFYPSRIRVKKKHRIRVRITGHVRVGRKLRKLWRWHSRNWRLTIWTCSSYTGPALRHPDTSFCRSCVSIGSLGNSIVNPDPHRSALVSVGWFRIQRGSHIDTFDESRDFVSCRVTVVGSFWSLDCRFLKA